MASIYLGLNVLTHKPNAILLHQFTVNIKSGLNEFNIDYIYIYI